MEFAALNPLPLEVPPSPFTPAARFYTIITNRYRTSLYFLRKDDFIPLKIPLTATVAGGGWATQVTWSL